MKIIITLIIAFSMLTLIVKAQMQSDQSERVWSIVMPEARAIDIDMERVLLGYTKDSVVSEFVSNAGQWRFRVDSIIVRGADADCFMILSGLPEYYLEPAQTQPTEFRFVPNRMGIHTAEIVIITQAETIVRNIRGEGVQPMLEIANDLIDFGQVYLSYSQDLSEQITIRNIGVIPIEITEIKHSFPNAIDFTTLNGGDNFTLQPNEVHLMDLRFAPSFVGRTSGTLEFHYEDIGSPAVVNLFGEGINLPDARATIETIELSAYPGDEIAVPVIFRDKENFDLNGINSIKFDLRFNPTLLIPLSHNFERLDEKTAVVTLENVNVNVNDGEEIALIKFKVGLGNAEKCELTFDNISSYESESQIETVNGTFNLLGVCYEGGARLLNPTGQSAIMNISPNPTEGIIAVELNLIEDGQTSFQIIDSRGFVVYETYISRQSELIEFQVKTDAFSTGTYFATLRTPTITQTQQLVIIR